MGRRTASIIGTTIAIVITLLLGWILTSERSLPVTGLIEMTDPTEIARLANVSRIGIATGENYFGHKIRVINGTLTNTSEKPLRAVEMKFVFLDYEGKPIQETVERAYTASQKPLAPAAQYRFEVNFENLPRNWNHRIPKIHILKLKY